MKPPPSRYSVEERNGRLAVIDTLSGDTPATARDIMGGDRISYTRASEAIAAPVAEMKDRMLDSQRIEIFDPDRSSERSAPAISTSAPRPESAKPVNPWAASESSSTLSTSVRKSIEPAGTAGLEPTVLYTQSWYDKNAPRTITLSPKRMQQALIGFILAILGAIILIAAFGLVALFVVGFFLIRFGISSATTKWLDAAERDAIR